MKIYKATSWYNNGGWGGCHNHEICLATTYNKALEVGLEYMKSQYPELLWDNGHKSYSSFETKYSGEIALHIREVEVLE